jgi:hypothetical protein
MIPSAVSKNSMELGATDFKIINSNNIGPKKRTAKHAYTIGQVKKYIMKFNPPSFVSTAYRMYIYMSPITAIVF